ncbi:MATE family efflux transporter [Lysobacter sp. N42]|nr:MATE family efflux transporter [Aliidiomarina sp. B3213]TCZ91033.1 MATE family efflux transporter [Lysobacter sp. N42]
MVISNIAAPLLGLVDTAIIGHLPDAIYLSAVAVGAMVVSFVYLLLIFLRMSTTGLAAHAYGARDREKLRNVWVDGVTTAVVCTGVIWLLKPAILALTWLLVEASPDLQVLASSYINIRFWSAPAALIMLVNLGVLLGMQKAKQAMALVVITNAVNVVGDVAFVIYMDLNVVGAAWASVLAEWVTALLGTIWVVRAIGISFSNFARPSWARLSALTSMNSDIFLRSVSLHLCMAMMTAWASYYGQVYVAANAVLLQFLMLISLGLDGVAYAAEALIGRAKGRHSSSQAKLWFRVSLQWSIGLAISYSLVFLVGGRFIVELITNIPEVVNTALTYLPWVVALPLVAHWSYLLDGVFIGLSASKQMRNSMMISAFAVFLPVWWFTQDFGNHGLWLALCCFMAARGLSQWWLTYKHKMLEVGLN